MNKNTKNILFTLGVSAAVIYSYNKFVETTATKKNLLTDDHGEYFLWKENDIFYTKTGSGSPLLLIHDADASASSVEWSKIIRRLEKKHTVYCIDLLGCGRSDKPALDYTNYLYTQLITSFIKDVIGEKTNVIATNMSASFVIMANHMDETLFEKMIFINPIPLKQLDAIPDENTKLKKKLVDLPFIGTFIYNVMTSSTKIDESFRTRYYAKPQLISSQMEDIYYESAHTDGSNGRFLYSSMLGNYLNNGVTHALKKINIPTLIIGSKEMKKYALALDDYHKINSNIEIMRISNGNLYPHLEIPDKIVSIINNYL